MKDLILQNTKIGNRKIEAVLKKYINDKLKDDNLEKVQSKIRECELFDFKHALIFHGGCLGCMTPFNETIEACYDCIYLRGVTTSFEDKSEKYKKDEE